MNASEVVIKLVTYRGKQVEVYIDRGDEAAYYRYTWSGSSDGGKSGNFYIHTKLYDPETRTSKTLYLHRYLMNPAEGMVVDHINRNTCDNRRSNLRVVTRAQNNVNSRGRSQVNGRPTSSKYKGVSRVKHRDRWRAKIGHAGKSYHLGVFDSETEAARAYDEKALEIHGEYAFRNFPEQVENDTVPVAASQRPGIPEARVLVPA